MAELKPCPFCGGEVSLILCDDEGNLHDESYRERTYSGLGFVLHHAHEGNGIGNQPGNHILSDLCRRRSAMRRLRKETPALHPAHGKLPQARAPGIKKRVWNVRENGTRQRYPTRGIA